MFNVVLTMDVRVGLSIGVSRASQRRHKSRPKRGIVKTAI